MDRLIALTLLGSAAGVAFAVRPGGVLAAVIRDSRAPFPRPLAAPAGRAAADLLFVPIAGFFALQFPEALAGNGVSGTATGLLAAAVLVVFGLLRMERHPPAALDRPEGESPAESAAEQVAAGFRATVADPAWLLFVVLAGVRLTAAAAAAGGPWGVVAAGLGFAAGGFAFHAAVAARLADGRRERAFAGRPFRILTSLGGLVLAGVGALLFGSVLAATPARGPLERFVGELFG